MTLGRTAAGLYWMFRDLERCETSARLLAVGQRIALTQTGRADDEWASVLATFGPNDAFETVKGERTQSNVIDWLLRDPANPNSVAALVRMARDNGRETRTAITRELWEAVNGAYMDMIARLEAPVSNRDLPDVLRAIREHNAYVRGALHGTMMRDEHFDFCRIGTYIERADATARLLDVKYHVLLPSPEDVGGTTDAVQWETILRVVSGEGGYRMLHGADVTARNVAEFLIAERRMPRSLAFCMSEICDAMSYLERSHGEVPSCGRAARLGTSLETADIGAILAGGLHEFLDSFQLDLAQLSGGIETDFRFYG